MYRILKVKAPNRARVLCLINENVGQCSLSAITTLATCCNRPFKIIKYENYALRQLTYKNVNHHRRVAELVLIQSNQIKHRLFNGVLKAYLILYLGNFVAGEYFPW
jgi:hypothetical protein